MGQFDKQKEEMKAALLTDPDLAFTTQISDKPEIPATPFKAARIPAVPNTAPGMVIEDDAAETYGVKQKPETLAGGRKPIALSRLAKSKADRIRTTGGNNSRITSNLDKARKNLSTTTMRLTSTGEAYEEPETKIGRPAPVIAGTHPAPVRRPKGKAGAPLKGPLISADADQRKSGEVRRQGRIRLEAKRQERASTAQDMLSGEAAFNANEESSGSTLRSKNGVTYDLADREAEATRAAATAKPTGESFFKPKLDKQKRPVIKKGPDKNVEYTFKGKTYTKTVSTSVLAGKNVPIKEETEPSTFDADLEKATSENNVIPKAPVIPKPKPEEESDNRPSSVVSTADELRSQSTKKDKEPGLSSGTDSKDIDNPEGDAYQPPADQAESIELDPDSEEGQAAAEEAKYKVKDTPRDRAENEREQTTRKAALEYEKAQKKLNKTRGPRKEKRLDAEGNVIPDEVDRGPNFKTQYEDPLDEQGNVKPAYNDPNYPNSTTMREVPVPKNLLKESVEEPIPSIGSQPDDRGTGGAERARRAQAGTDILEHGVGSQMKGPKTKIVEGRIDRVPKAVIDNGRTVPTKSGKVIPMRAFEDTSAPGEEAITYNEVVQNESSGKPLSDDERFAAAQKQTSTTKTGVYTSANRAKAASAGRDEFQQVSDAARLSKFKTKLGDDYEDTRYDQKVKDTAMAIAMREGTIKNAGDLDNPEIMSGTGMRQHTAKAFVLHKTGGASDASEEKLDVVAGGPRGSHVNNTAIQGMHDTLKAEEKFHASKTPGTGVTYSMDDSGDNKLDADKVHFRAKNGALVPLSEINHPDHPLPGGKGYVEGSHVFKGGRPNPKAPGKFVAFEGHQGWHPTPGITHPETGKQITLLEKHSIPTGSKHEGEIIRDAVSAGESLSATRKKLLSGQDTDLGFEKAERAPVKGASRKKHEEITNTLNSDLENSGVPVTSSTMPASGPVNGPWPKPEETPTFIPRTQESMTAGVTVEQGAAAGLARGGQIMSQGNRLPTTGPRSETALKAEAGKLGVKGSRKIARAAAEKVQSITPKMFTPGESVYHPKHGVGTVVSHGLVMGGTGQTTATVKFGEKEKTFTGDNLHTHVTDKQGKTTKNQELSRFTPTTLPTAVTHKQHGTGTVVGYSSNHDGSGKTHIKFDSGSTKAIADTNKLEY
jgi:hypothetical protein